MLRDNHLLLMRSCAYLKFHLLLNLYFSCQLQVLSPVFSFSYQCLFYLVFAPLDALPFWPCTLSSLIFMFCYSHFFIHFVHLHLAPFIVIFRSFAIFLFLSASLFCFLLFYSSLVSFLRLLLLQVSPQSSPFVSLFLSFIPALQLSLCSLLCS